MPHHVLRVGIWICLENKSTNMPANKFYPALVDLLPVENLPASLGPVKEGIENLFKRLFYKNLQVEKSVQGDTGFYRLSIVAYQRIGLEIPGTGFALVLNPDDSGLSITDVPISFSYRWEILKHINNFQISSFSEAPDAFFQLFLDITELTAEEVLEEAIGVFVSDPDPLNAFISQFNAIHQSSINLSPPPNTTVIEHLVQQIEGLGLDVFMSVFNDFIQTVNSFDEIMENIKKLFKKWLGEIDIEDVKRMLIPQVALSIDSLNLGILFPTSVLRQVDTSTSVSQPVPTYEPLQDVNGDDVPSILKFDVGSLMYSTENGIEFGGNFNFQDFPVSEILRTGFCIGFSGMKLDLSRSTNIAEADADGRPADFVGAYIEEATILFPAFWQHDSGASTGVLKGRNLLIGTGGLSGTIGMEAVTMGDPSPLIKVCFGSGFQVSLEAFSLTFQQNAIVESTIKGKMVIPKFEDANGDPAELEIDIHIGQDGDFSVTVSEADGIPICIPDVLLLTLRSASIGRQDGRFFLAVSGALTFDHGSSVVGQILPAAIDFQEIIIWDDGQFEIKGGSLELPQALSLKFPPVELSVTAIHLGSIEREYDNGGTMVLRKYKYFGFDGGVKVDPGGVEAKGKGIQVYFSTDNDTLPLDIFIRIESIRIDLIIPGNVDPADATLLISGFLSMKEPPAGIPGTEYAGGITFDMPKAGIGGAAAMRFNPKVPYFIIDAEVEISKAIPLGNTGLGLYGFRGLIGKHFVATKNAAGVADSEPWWKYYKAKIDPDYKEGVQISKFDPIGGFALGLGVSLATATDGGKVFSSKIFLLLSLRELLMLQGQAAILDDRIRLSDPNDPPFFALIVLTRQSVEAALGVNYLIPDDKDPGSIATVTGVLELGFFFNDSSAWYLNIGRDLPESYRISVRLFDLFDCYFYFMLNAYGIRAGAGASFDIEKKFGPLRAHLYAYLDIAGKVAFKPKQIGGSIQLGGGVELSIFGMGFSVSAAASLAAESPEPFLISGSVEACIRVLRKDRCAKFEFTWNFNDNVDTSEIGVIDKADIGGAAQALNIQTRETFTLNFVKESSGMVYRGTSNPGSPSSWLPPAPGSSHWNASFEKHIIPLDCFIDIDFKNGLNPNGGASTDDYGKNGGANFIQFVPPQKGKTPRVKHSYLVEDIFIYAWNPSTSTWEEYDMYDALTPLVDLPFVDPAVVAALNLKKGYWQLEEPNKYNKLRILSQTPLSYVTEASGTFVPENSGVTSETIFCEEEAREKCCINFVRYIPLRKEEVYEVTQGGDWPQVPLPKPVGVMEYAQTSNAMANIAANGTMDLDQGQYLYSPALSGQSITQLTAGQLHFFEKASFKLLHHDGSVVDMGQPHLGNSVALTIQEGDCLEITFNEPMACVDLCLSTFTMTVTVEYYQLVIDPNSSNGVNIIEQQVGNSLVLSSADLQSKVQYLDADLPIDKVLIKVGACKQGSNPPLLTDAEMSMEAAQLETFLNTLARNRQLVSGPFNLNPDHSERYNGVFLNTVLYQYPGGEPITVGYQVQQTAGNAIDFQVSDHSGYTCNFRLESPGQIDWTRITSLENLRPNPSILSEGENFDFLVEAQVERTGVVTLMGRTDNYNIVNAHRKCAAFLYEVCFMNGEDYAYNLTIPGSAAVTAETDSMIDALEKTFQPIWRPNTKFAVAIKTNEAVSGGGSDNHRNTFYFGFQTKGPVGHFHQYENDSNLQVFRADYADLLAIDREDSYQLSKLQHYIDYRRSYPNADGDLLNAKPLFYKNPRLLMFFKKQYVYSMFGNWDGYLGNGPVVGSMGVVIQDALEPPVEPVATPGWALDPHSIKGKDISILNNMIQNAPASDCPPDDPIAQNGVNSVVDIDQLEPLKLYTAIFNNVFQRDSNASTPTVSREVHRYPFRTSRYGNFKEQVLSYQLLVDDLTSTVLKSAVFNIEKDVPAAALSLAGNILGGSADLLTDYADFFERILQGALKLGTLHPAISTEFNPVHNVAAGGNLLGVWIRCPEPFNDPKIPGTEMANTIKLTVNGDSSANYKAIFSKDGREAFVTKQDNSLNMPYGNYAFTFDYKEWDGQAYVAVETQTVNITIDPIS